ncbi:LysR family transcriptional regulator [Ramlibacter sp.]|uniref:LysR family transcriptional regulator n=1 Tax=Ramlibacter sp. TaxID=1917967 RepID=UPI0017B2A9D4|nr:LysR family transcriptional regulator [Ramlibacter sp.]MBA2675401.1 LysR family transcriptional regulator [Ramlibacter sp.]
MVRNLQGMVSFVESAAAGSFTAAAARLGVTPAAVGKNVMRLEQELKVRLFNRTTRRLQLTAEGQSFLAEARDALQALDRAVENLTRTGSQPAGRVRISSSTTFGRRFVLPLLPQLARRHPQLQVELSLDNRVIDVVEEGYDIVVRGGILRDSTLVARRICRLHSVLVASPAYLRKHGVPASPDDLLSHRLLGIRFASGDVAEWSFSTPGGGRIAWSPPAQVWSSDPDAFLDVVVAGEGICQAALFLAAPLLRAGKLRTVLAGQYHHGERDMMLCYPHRKLLSPRVRVVVDHLAAGFREEPDLRLDPAAMPRAWRATAG